MAIVPFVGLVKVAGFEPDETASVGMFLLPFTAVALT
jgi:hypothetical protein